MGQLLDHNVFVEGWRVWGCSLFGVRDGSEGYGRANWLLYLCALLLCCFGVV